MPCPMPCGPSGPCCVPIPCPGPCGPCFKTAPFTSPMEFKKQVDLIQGGGGGARGGSSSNSGGGGGKSSSSGCPTCNGGGNRGVMDAMPRKNRPSEYGSPGALSTPGAGCGGPPCLGRRECPPPCQPQFPPMLPCCTNKCGKGGPCPTPGTSLLVGMKPPEPKCNPCCGKPPACTGASEFPFGDPSPCAPCTWPPLCLG